MRKGLIFTTGAGLCFLMGCARMDKDPTPHTANATEIGLVLPLTGGGGQLSLHEQYAAYMAVNEINAAGGVNGRPLDLLLRDDQASATVGEAMASQLVQDHIAVLIGSAYSGVCAGIITNVTDPILMPVISPSATSPTLTGLAPNHTFFRTAPSDAFQGVVLASEVFQEGVTDVAIIHVNGAYGQGLAGAFQTKFQALGGSIRQVVGYDLGPVSFTSQVASLFAKGVPQAVLIIAYVNDGANVTRDIGLFNPQPAPRYFGGESLDDPGLLANGDASVIAGLMGTVNVPPLKADSYRTYAANFMAGSGQSPNVFSECAYDAVYLAAMAMETGKANTPAAVLANLRAVSNPSATPQTDVKVGPDQWGLAAQTIQAGGHVNYQGASGNIGWDPNGDVTSATYNIYKVVGTPGNFSFQVVKTISYP